jgi:hypothetical protein
MRKPAPILTSGDSWRLAGENQEATATTTHRTQTQASVAQVGRRRGRTEATWQVWQGERDDLLADAQQEGKN